MPERTYANPGDCVKCGSGKVSLQWSSVATQMDGTVFGDLYAYCDVCGYQWTVVAKDTADLAVHEAGGGHGDD